MFTIADASRSASAGSAARECTKKPRTFVVMTPSHSSSLVSRMPFMRKRAALLTRTSRRPKRSMAAATAASAVAASATSPCTATIRPSSVSRSATAGFRSSATTLAPAACSRRTTSLPTPPAAPVTIATCPSNSLMAAMQSQALGGR